MESTATGERFVETSNLLRPGRNITAKGFVMQLIRLNSSQQPNTVSMWVVGTLIVCYCVVSFGLACTVIYSWDAIAAGETWTLVLTLFLAALLVIFCIFISIQPRQKFLGHSKPFKVKQFSDLLMPETEILVKGILIHFPFHFRCPLFPSCLR